MGLYQHLYVGPYVECKHRPRTRTEAIRTCLNTSCVHHGRLPHQRGVHGGDDRFCAKCGSAVGPFDRTVECRMSHHDVVGDDVLTEINPNSRSSRLCLGTNTTKTPRDFSPDADDTHLDIAGVDIAAEIAWFERTYAEVIAALRAEYDDVQVTWGVHAYRY